MVSPASTVAMVCTISLIVRYWKSADNKELTGVRAACPLLTSVMTIVNVSPGVMILSLLPTVSVMVPFSKAKCGALIVNEMIVVSLKFPLYDKTTVKLAIVWSGTEALMWVVNISVNEILSPTGILLSERWLSNKVTKGEVVEILIRALFTSRFPRLAIMASHVTVWSYSAT